MDSDSGSHCDATTRLIWSLAGETAFKPRWAAMAPRSEALLTASHGRFGRGAPSMPIERNGANKDTCAQA